MLGGVLGIAIAQIMKNSSRGMFFLAIIGGVALLFLFMLVLQTTSSSLFQGFMITAAAICGLGFSHVLGQQKKYR